MHFDWFGPIKELEEIDKKLKELWNGSDGVELLGRFSPHNHKFHWTWFVKAKDMETWVKRKRPTFYKRDYKVHTHQIAEYYE